MIIQIDSVPDEAVDYENEQSQPHGCSNIEIGQPNPSKATSKTFHPTVEHDCLEHEIVGLDYDAVLVRFEEQSHKENCNPYAEVG